MPVSVHRLRNHYSAFRVASVTQCTHRSKVWRIRSVCWSFLLLLFKCQPLCILCSCPHVSSVLGKVGGVPGWQALLSAVGFRLDFSGSVAGLPAAVFFPMSDPGDRLQQCSTTLQSLLGNRVFPLFKSSPMSVILMKSYFFNVQYLTKVSTTLTFL